MTSVKKRVKAADAAVGRLARLLAQMGLGSGLSGKGSAVPKKDEGDWKLPREVRILLRTKKGLVEQFWSSDAIKDLPDQARSLFRLLTYNDVPAQIRDNLKGEWPMDEEWQSLFLDVRVSDVLLDIVEQCMQNPKSTIINALVTAKLGEMGLINIQSLAELLPVPSLLSAAACARNQLEQLNASRDLKREAKASGLSVGGALADERSAAHSEGDIAAGQGPSQPADRVLRALLEEIQDEASDVKNPPEEESQVMVLSCNTSTGERGDVRVLLGSKTPLGSAKVLLFELGCDYVKDLNEAGFQLLMKQVGWELLAVGKRGAEIAAGCESASYTTIGNIIKTAAHEEGQVVHFTKVNGRQHLMSALIMAGNYPTFLASLADLCFGGRFFNIDRPAETASTYHKAKTSPVIKVPAKQNDALGQMVNILICALRTSKAPPLVTGGDHSLRGLAAFASLHPHPRKPGEHALTFYMLRLDPRLLNALIPKWTQCADAYINGKKDAFPSQILHAWMLMKQRVAERVCKTVSDAEALAETLRELSGSIQEVMEEEEDDDEDDDAKEERRMKRDAKEEERRLIEALRARVEG